MNRNHALPPPPPTDLWPIEKSAHAFAFKSRLFLLFLQIHFMDHNPFCNKQLYARAKQTFCLIRCSISMFFRFLSPALLEIVSLLTHILRISTKLIAKRKEKTLTIKNVQPTVAQFAANHIDNSKS